MADFDISALDAYFRVQSERLQSAEQKKYTSKIKYEISRTKAIIAISRRIIIYTYFKRKYQNVAVF